VPGGDEKTASSSDGMDGWYVCIVRLYGNGAATAVQNDAPVHFRFVGNRVSGSSPAALESEMTADSL